MGGLNLSMTLHGLGVGDEVGRVHRTSWGWLFWLVWRRGDVRTSVLAWRAGALALMFIVACGGADGSGWQDVGVDAAAIVGKDGVVGVEGAGGGDNAGGVIVAAAAAVGVIAGDAVVVAFCHRYRCRNTEPTGCEQCPRCWIEGERCRSCWVVGVEGEVMHRVFERKRAPRHVDVSRVSTWSVRKAVV